MVVPPLSGARLRQALPNVVEEFLLQDVSNCLIVPGPATADGKRLIGVVDSDWVEFVVGAFSRREMRVEALWPAQLALPLAGLMSLEPFEAVTHDLHALREAAYTLGCVLPEPFLQVAFLALPVIPHLKMTDRGLFDVDKFDFVD